ncbi:MAG: DNA-binding protein [Oscillospiraceae bacterium]|nr:DNA-binding protein [Oscillospiraceae bacterium]
MDEKCIQSAIGRQGRVVAFRLMPETDVLLGIAEACRRYDIKNAVIVSAIGSLHDVKYCNVVEMPEKKVGYGYSEALTLSGPIEMTGASGIVCHDDNGEINLHVHFTMSDRYGTGHGGHLVEGTKVLITVDVVVAELEGIDMCREYDEYTDVFLFSPRQLPAE